MSYWQTLIREHATPEKRVCNCGNAYETLHPNGALTPEGPIDAWKCAHGCSAAQIDAREYIAKRVLVP